MYKSILLVFFGGGLGSVLRFLISNVLNNEQFPYGTLTANLLGSLLIGIFLGLFENEIFNNTHKLIFVVGFCGGFTTFSSFVTEKFKMLQANNLQDFMLYSMGSIILGLCVVWVGFKVSKFF